MKRLLLLALAQAFSLDATRALADARSADAQAPSAAEKKAIMANLNKAPPGKKKKKAGGWKKKPAAAPAAAPAPVKTFGELDANKDGKLSQAEFDGVPEPAAEPMPAAAAPTPAQPAIPLTGDPATDALNMVVHTVQGLNWTACNGTNGTVGGLNVSEVIVATAEAAHAAHEATVKADAATSRAEMAVQQAVDYGKVAGEVYQAAKEAETTAQMNLDLAKRHTPPFIYAHAGRKAGRTAARRAAKPERKPVASAEPPPRQLRGVSPHLPRLRRWG